MNSARRARRGLGLRLATLALVGTSVALMAPGTAVAQSDPIKLALLPVGQAGSFFDLTMTPGASRSFAVEIANDGTAALAVRSYAADVYTIINGGFGARLRGEAQSGTTSWLDYATVVLPLGVGQRTSRAFTVTVPRDTAPGEYITCLILENDLPLLSNGAVALDQIVRQAVAVVVTVPGARSPALAIGAATHKVVDGRSVVDVAVSNAGNIRLKPLVSLSLSDAAGIEFSQASIRMDTFYAHTETFVEFPLALLPPGAYTVRLVLDDTLQGAHADRAGIPLLVDAPPAEATGTSAAAGAAVASGPPAGGQAALPFLAVALLAGLALLFAGAMFVYVPQRRRRRLRFSDPPVARPGPPRIRRT